MKVKKPHSVALLLFAALAATWILGCAKAGPDTASAPANAYHETTEAADAPMRAPGDLAIMPGDVAGSVVARNAVDARPVDPSALAIQPGEELWVIVEPERRKAPGDDVPGCGALMATLPGETEQVPVPLKHTDVQGDIQSYIASVSVTQQFHNPYDSKIEAVYVFPLPQNAAVNDFIMTVGERKIRGVIREREEAEKIYKAARSQGYVASLMTQERPNIFTQKVANIEPGKQIDINIKYFNTLQYDDGWYEFVFPMVVGPRFNPPCTSDGVGAVARGDQGTSGQKTEVQYLAPNERSGHDISLALNLDAGLKIEDIRSVNHRIEKKNGGPSGSSEQLSVRLAADDTLPNEDFVLRFRVAGRQVQTSLMAHQSDEGKYFTLVAYPPHELEHQARCPLEMIFVLDCSGSMRGAPMKQAKAAVASALNDLRPDDSFQIIRFSSNASQLGGSPLLATPRNIRRGLKYLNSLSGTGGTQMIEGMRAALDFPHDDSRLRVVSFMTDGFIGNEAKVLSNIQQRLGDSRIFSFGVGQAPNRFLMDRMALLGRGAVAYLSLNDNAEDVMDRFAQRISHPAMTEITVDWGDARVDDVYPNRLPDLIVGRHIVLTGRYEGELESVRIRGLVNGELTQLDVPVSSALEHTAIPAVWARMKIADLINRSMYEPNEGFDLKNSVTQVALKHNLMSSYTAMIAVDSMTKTVGDFGTTVAVPVPVPNGTRYETAIQN